MIKRAPDAAQDVPPQQLPQMAPQGGMDAYTFMMNATFEINNTVGKLDAKIDNLGTKLDGVSKDVGASSERLIAIEKKAAMVTGALVTAGVLIPLAFAVLWWALGERIEAALIKAPVAAAISAPVAPNP